MSFFSQFIPRKIINGLKIILISCKRLQKLIQGFWTCGHLSILGKIIPSNFKVLKYYVIYCKNDLHNLLTRME